MLIPLGILAGSGAAVFEDAYELISTTTLGAAASSVTFSSLGGFSSDYKHLQLRVTARTAQTGNFTAMAIRLNGDTGSNYAAHRVRAEYQTVSSSNNTSDTKMLVGTLSGADKTSNFFGSSVIEILDAFNSSKAKTITCISGATGSLGGRADFSSGLFTTTAGITSIQFLSENLTSNLQVGSRFSLYGIRG
jgi:hypothetical protein